MPIPNRTLVALLTTTAVAACSSGGGGSSSPAFDLVVTSAAGPGVGRALRFDVASGALIGNFNVGGALVDPRDVLPDPANPNTVLINGGNDDILRFRASDGLFLQAFGSATDLNPGGGVFGPNGNYFVGSRSSGTVVEFDATTGQSLGDFFAPGTLDFPRGFVFAGSGDLFIGNGADPVSGGGGGSIVRIDGSSGAVLDTSFVTDPELSPLDVIEGLDGNLYVSSEFPFGQPNATGTVRVYDVEDGSLLQVLDPGLDINGAPLLLAPRGMGFGPDGLLYVSSTGTDSVLRFDPASGDFVDVVVTFENLFGQALTFVAPTGVEVERDVDFDVVVTSFGGGIGRPVRFDGNDGARLPNFDMGGTLSDPRDILPDPGVPNSVLINGGADDVLRFRASDGFFLGTFASASGLNAGGGVFGPNGNYFAGSRTSGTIVEFDGTTGSLIGDFNPPGSVDFPRGFVFAGSGDLFLGNGADPITGGGGGGIVRIEGSSGAVVDANFVSDPELSPLDVIEGLDGNLYVSSEFPFGAPDAVASVRVYDVDDGSLLSVLVAPTDADGQALLQAPRGMGFGPDGLLYVSSTGTDSVLRFDPVSGTFVDVFASAEGLLGQALTFVPKVDLVVSSAGTIGNNSVLRFDGSSGSLLGDFQAPGSSLVDPRDVFRREGLARELLVVSGSDELLRFDALDGSFLGTFASSSGLNGGGGVFGPGGNVFVGARSAGSIVEFDGTDGSLVGDFVASGSVDFPRGFVFGPDGNLLLGNGADPASGGGGGGIVLIDGVSGSVLVGDIANDPLLSPLDVILGSDGLLYVSSEFPFGAPDASGTVRVYDPASGILQAVLDPGNDTNGAPLLQAPRGMGFGPDGLLYVSSTGTDSILRIDPESGDLVDVFATAPNLFGQALNFVPRY